MHEANAQLTSISTEHKFPKDKQDLYTKHSSPHYGSFPLNENNKRTHGCFDSTSYKRPRHNGKQQRRVQFSAAEPTIHCLKRPNYGSSNRFSLKNVFDDDEECDDESAAQQQEDNQMKRDMWYTRRELGEMKVRERLLCEKINLDFELQEIYSSCSNKEGDDEEELHQQVQIPSSNKVYNVFKLLSNSLQFEQQRGLERWSSRDHYRARGLCLLCTKTAFFVEQSRQFCCGQPDPIRLAAVYQHASAPAVRFARLLGQADVDLVWKSK